MADRTLAAYVSKRSGDLPIHDCMPLLHQHLFDNKADNPRVNESGAVGMLENIFVFDLYPYMISASTDQSQIYRDGDDAKLTVPGAATDDSVKQLCCGVWSRHSKLGPISA